MLFNHSAYKMRSNNPENQCSVFVAEIFYDKELRHSNGFDSQEENRQIQQTFFFKCELFLLLVTLAGPGLSLCADCSKSSKENRFHLGLNWNDNSPTKIIVGYFWNTKRQDEGNSVNVLKSQY